MKKYLRPEFVSSVKPPLKGQVDYLDDPGHRGGVRGFGLRVSEGGTKSWVILYTRNGTSRRHTFGTYPQLGLADAREEAKRKLGDVQKGIDPSDAKRADRDSVTVNELADDWIEHATAHKREGSVKEDKALIGQFIRPKLGTRFVKEIEKHDVERLHNALHDKPFRANRLLSLLKSMFYRAIEKKWATENPCVGIMRYEEPPRERYLTLEELQRVGAALAAYPVRKSADGGTRIDPRLLRSARAIELLILTGARRGEVLKAEWGEFNLNAGTWTKPSHHTKQRKKSEIPLNQGALRLLREMRSNASDIDNYVFQVPDGKHLLEIKKAWAVIADDAAIEGVRLHDLRHSHASILASRGVSLQMIGRLLGHTQPNTTQRYAHLHDNAIRAATEHAADIMGIEAMPSLGELYQQAAAAVSGAIVVTAAPTAKPRRARRAVALTTR